MMMPKHALVTGAARRIGRATCLELAHNGYAVLGVIRSHDDDARSLESELQSLNPLNRLIVADLQSVDSLDLLERAVHDTFGRCNLLVNSASLYEPDDTELGPSIEQTRRLMRINYVIPHQLTMRLGPLLTDAGGSVVNFVDLLAEKPWPKYSGYCASKAALLSVTQSMARLLAPKARVNGISPGMVGPFKPDVTDDPSAYLKRVPLGRPGEFAEAARLVRFLADEATYLTGEIVRLDGGRHLV